jgi:hypothetical protein
MKDYLIDLLSKYLYKKDFFFEKKNYRFTRTERERTCSVRLVFVRNVEVFIYYEIRFNLIERLIDAYYGRKSKLLDPTIFINTGDLLVETNLYKFPIDTSRAVEESSEDIINIIENLAFNYFNKYETLDHLHSLLNEIPFQSMKIRNDKYHNEVISGFFRGVLTARLLNKDIETIARKHIEYLTNNGYGVEDVKHYMNFLQWVDNIPAGSSVPLEPRQM